MNKAITLDLFNTYLGSIPSSTIYIEEYLFNGLCDTNLWEFLNDDHKNIKFYIKNKALVDVIEHDFIRNWDKGFTSTITRCFF